MNSQIQCTLIQSVYAFWFSFKYHPDPAEKHSLKQPLASVSFNIQPTLSDLLCTLLDLKNTEDFELSFTRQ